MVPIRQDNSDRVIAVAEFYERADQLKQDISRTRRGARLGRNDAQANASDAGRRQADAAKAFLDIRRSPASAGP
jgi:hypothetical protein